MVSSSPFNVSTLHIFQAISMACSALLALSIAFQLRAEFSIDRRLQPFLNGRVAGAVFFLGTIVQAVFLEAHRSSLPVAWDSVGGGDSGNRTGTSCSEASFDRASVHILTMLAPSPFLFAPQIWQRIIPASAAMCGLFGLVILAKDLMRRPDRLTLRLSVVVGGLTVFHHVVIAVSVSTLHVLFVCLGVITSEILGMTLSAVRSIAYAVSLPDTVFFPQDRWRRLAAGMPAYPRLFALSHLFGMVWVLLAGLAAVLPAWSGDWAASEFCPLGCVLLAMLILELYTQAVSETQVLAISQKRWVGRSELKHGGLRQYLMSAEDKTANLEEEYDSGSAKEWGNFELRQSGVTLSADLAFVDHACKDKISAFHCHLLNDSSLQPITPLLLFLSFLLFALTAVFAWGSEKGELNPDGTFQGRWKDFPRMYAWLCMILSGCMLPRFAALQVCFSRGYAHAPLLQISEASHPAQDDIGSQIVDSSLAVEDVGEVAASDIMQPANSQSNLQSEQCACALGNWLRCISLPFRLFINKASSWKGQQLIAAANFALSAIFFLYLIASGHVSNAPTNSSSNPLSNCAPLGCGECFSTADDVSSGSIGCGWCVIEGGSGVCLNGKKMSSDLELPVATGPESAMPHCLTFNMTAAATSGWCKSVSCESMLSCQNCSARADCGWCSNGWATGCHQVDKLANICPGSEVIDDKECGLTICSERSSLKECVLGPSPHGLCGWCSVFKQCRLVSSWNPYISADGDCQSKLSNWLIAVPGHLPFWNQDYPISTQRFDVFQDPCWQVGDSCESCANQTVLLKGAYPCVWCPTMKRCISSSFNMSSSTNITDAPGWAVQQTQLCMALQIDNSIPALVDTASLCAALVPSSPENHCSQHDNCISCSLDSQCGWCGHGKGSCMVYGNSTSSLDGGCSHGPWWMPQVRACTLQEVGQSGCSQQTNCYECMSFSLEYCDWCEASASCRQSGTCDTSKPVVSGGSLDGCHLSSSSNCTSLSGSTNCIDCASVSSCWWTAATGKCFDLNLANIGQPYDCPRVQASACHEAHQQGCAACLTIPGCGFCARAPDDASGLCLEGNMSGAFNSSCSYGRWSFGNPQVCNVNYFPYEVTESSTPGWIRQQESLKPFADDPETSEGKRSAHIECSLRQSCSHCISQGCQWCASRELGPGFGGYCSPRSSSPPNSGSNCTWNFEYCPLVDGATSSCELCIQNNPTFTFETMRTAIETNSSWLPVAEQKWGIIPNISSFNYSQGHSSVRVSYSTSWCWSSWSCINVFHVGALEWTQTVDCGKEQLIPNAFSTLACQDPCVEQSFCGSCAALPYCGWCQNGKGTIGGQCFMANMTSALPLQSHCSANQWVKPGDLDFCDTFRPLFKASTNLFVTTCLEELTMAAAACCVAIIGLFGIAWTLLVQKHPSWKIGWLPTDDLFRLGTLVKAYLAAVKALLLGQMLTSKNYSSHGSQETIVLLVLFLASFLAVFWITIVDFRRLWSTVKRWKIGAPFPITAKHPRMFVCTYGFLFLWVKITLLLIGVGGHLSAQIVATARYLVASASVGVVVNNEVAQRLRMAIIAVRTDGTVMETSVSSNGSSSRYQKSSPARLGISMKGLSSLVPVAIAIGVATCGYFAVAAHVLLDSAKHSVETDTGLVHVAIGLTIWVGLYICGLIALLWSYNGVTDQGRGRYLSRTGVRNFMQS